MTAKGEAGDLLCSWIAPPPFLTPPSRNEKDKLDGTEETETRMDKSKRNIGLRALRVLMAVILAIITCVPAMALSGKAYAADGSYSATLTDQWSSRSADDLEFETQGGGSRFDPAWYQMDFTRSELAGMVLELETLYSKDLMVVDRINYYGPATFEYIWNDGTQDIIKITSTMPQASDDEPGFNGYVSDNLVDPSNWNEDFSAYKCTLNISVSNRSDGAKTTGSFDLPVIQKGDSLYEAYRSYARHTNRYDVAVPPVFYQSQRMGDEGGQYFGAFSAWAWLDKYDRSVDITKDNGNIDLSVNNQTVNLSYNEAQKEGTYKLTVANKSATTSVKPDSVKNITLDVSDLDAGTYSITGGIDGQEPDVEGTLKVVAKDTSKPCALCLTSPEGIMKGVEYNVYKLFDADVDENGVARNVSIISAIGQMPLKEIEGMSSPRPSSSHNGNQVIFNRAMAELGKPYAFEGVGPAAYDASGLVSYCVTGRNTKIGTAASFKNWEQTTDPKPGDICTNGHHCGIYIGNNQMVHAPAAGVMVSDVQAGMTFHVAPTGGDDSSDTPTLWGSDWANYTVSAYGGSSDSTMPNPGTTATGATVDDDSMGVAISSSVENYRSYFGKTVEITFNGKTTYAPINDVVSSPAVNASIQPGVMKALGFYTVQSFGKRTVSMRVLDAPASAASLAALSDDEGFNSAQEKAEFIAKNIKDGDSLYKDSFGMNLAKAVANAYEGDPKFIVNVADEQSGNAFTDNENDLITFSDTGAVVCADTAYKLLELIGSSDWNDLNGKNITMTVGGKEITVPIKAYSGKGTGIYITTASLGDITPNENEFGDKSINPEKIVFEGKELPSDIPATVTTQADMMCSVLDGEGYYLIVRKDSLDGEKSVASSPIFVAVHEGENNVEIKAGIPMVDKLINEDSTDTWGKEADHSVNQVVPYQITGSVAENVDAYTTYKYVFHDAYDASRMTIDPASVKVAIGDQVLDASTYTVSFAKNADGADEMTVAFDDLYAAKSDLANTDKVVLTYNATQTGTAAPDGIVNTVYLEYANNPVNLESTGTTEKAATTDYSYAFRIHKTDNSTGESLAGAKFTVQNSNNMYIAKNADGKIVELAANEDGTAPEGSEWTTDENGFIVLDGIDVDTYTATETAAPSDKYDMLDAPFNFTISIGTDEAGNTDRAKVENAVAENNLVKAENDDTITYGSVVVKNIKKIELPSTGESGLRVLLIIALSVGVAAYIKRRNRKENTAGVLTI